MGAVRVLTIVFALICATLAAPQVDKVKLKFKVSGRNLPDKDDIGTSDPYYEVFYTTDDGASKTKIGKSDTITDQENPEWANVFEFDFDRSKNQVWYFHVWDEDTLQKDDTVGRVYVNVADYVDKGQFVNSNLDKGGYLIIQSSDSSAKSAGSIPFPPGTPDSMTLRFRVSAANLPTKDDVTFIPGKSDPYVIIKSSEGPAGTEHELGRTKAQSSTKNPNWSEVFTLKWSKDKDQRLHFKIYDEDNLRRDDKLGQGWIEVNDYVAHNQDFTVILAKQDCTVFCSPRTLTITKA